MKILAIFLKLLHRDGKMRTIRNSVFETNSSSMHSISFASDAPIVTVKELYINASGEYGWDIIDYSDPNSKLDYATVAFLLKARSDIKSELEEDVKDYIDEKLQNVVDCFASHGVTVNFANDMYEVEVKRYSSIMRVSVTMSGYIDHQSAPYKDGDSDSDVLADWFANNPEELFRFVFNNSSIHTDNDNH